MYIFLKVWFFLFFHLHGSCVKMGMAFYLSMISFKPFRSLEDKNIECADTSMLITIT